MGVVAPGLNIDAKGTAAGIISGMEPVIYNSPNTSPYVANGGLGLEGGFSDLLTRNASQAHLYTFTFAPGVSVNNFSLRMLDYGDWNPTQSVRHYVSMTAYNASGVMVAKQELMFNSESSAGPTSSDYGNLQITGDAMALPGQPGNWTWNVFGIGIVRVVLEFGEGFDPNIAFDTLTFITECPQVCTSSMAQANFRKVALGQSVEGLGVVAPGLNIDAKGTAAGIISGMEPVIYNSPNTSPYVANGGLGLEGGFSDLLTRNASQAHLYTFTFAPGVSVNNFSLRMLDYGDWNPTQSVRHYVSMTAYNASGVMVAKQELMFNSESSAGPTSSDYGNLQITGDAMALPGQPGNWTWNVFGIGIVRVVLEFGEGFDPNIAFDTLTFITECK
jgi:hypothetical protein